MARSTIDEIYIQNFKFFPNYEAPIKLDGKHLLLYGENGSGKSSVYWALYTLMECANKEEVSEIKKYFNPAEDNEERLTNIYLKPGDTEWIDSSISIKLKDGTEYKVSFNDTDINLKTEAQENNYASDFIYYRMLFRIYNFAHSEPIELSHLFKADILPYVKFSPVTMLINSGGQLNNILTVNANKIWEYVNVGPDKNILNKKLKYRFPLKSEPQFEDYQNIVNGFKNNLNDLLTYINTQGNPILVTQLGYDIQYQLILQETPFKLSHQKFVPPKFEIFLKITNYKGKIDAVKRPHSFLNEAKLTAVALAIRLAVLQKRLADAKLRILVLDDLLISLDMRNREKVLDIILDKLTNDYQVLLLTHDRNFYHFVKLKIERKNQSDLWHLLEMYESKLDSIPKPFIKIPLSDIDQAKAYFIEHEYEAAGNSLRRATEDFCERFLPRKYLFTLDLIKKSLDGQLNDAKSYAESNGIDNTLFEKLINLNRNVFNKLSHSDYDVPIFTNEIEAAFITFEELKKIKFKKLVESETKLYCEMKSPAGENWQTDILVFDDLFEIREEGKDSILTKGKILFEMNKDGNKQPHLACKIYSLKERYDFWYQSSDKTKSDIFWEEIIFSTSGKPLSSERLA